MTQTRLWHYIFLITSIWHPWLVVGSFQLSYQNTLPGLETTIKADEPLSYHGVLPLSTPMLDYVYCIVAKKFSDIWVKIFVSASFICVESRYWCIFDINSNCWFVVYQLLITELKLNPGVVDLVNGFRVENNTLLIQMEPRRILFYVTLTDNLILGLSCHASSSL